MGRAKIYWSMHLPETFEVQAQEFQKLNSLLILRKNIDLQNLLIYSLAINVVLERLTLFYI